MGAVRAKCKHCGATIYLRRFIRLSGDGVEHPADGLRAQWVASRDDHDSWRCAPDRAHCPREGQIKGAAK